MPQTILLIILLLSVLALCVVAGPRLWIPLGVTLGVACVTVLPLSLFTLVTTRRRYHDWIDKMVAAYLDAEKEEGRPITPPHWGRPREANPVDAAVCCIVLLISRSQSKVPRAIVSLVSPCTSGLHSG